MRGFLLAAGLGTRLRPLSAELPKPGWPLFDVPLAAHLMGLFAEAGIPETVVNLHHLPHLLRQVLEPHIPRGLRVHWSLENPIRGTGGALPPWASFLGEGTFVLANADTYQELDLAAMVRFHRERCGWGTLSLRRAPPGAAAPIEVDADGRIVRFLRARAPAGGTGTPCVFTGVHVLEPEVLDRIPAPPCCINAEVHAALVAEGRPLWGFVSPARDFWSDLGTPDLYLAGHRELLRRGGPRVRPPDSRIVREDTRLPGGGEVRAPCYLGAGVQVEAGARVGPNAVLGAGAGVAAGARVADAVLWPGARVGPGTVERCVVSPSGCVLHVPEPQAPGGGAP